MTLREELEELLLHEAAQSKAMRLAVEMMERGSTRIDNPDQAFEMLFALNVGLRKAVFRLAEHVERIEMRLGPEDDD